MVSSRDIARMAGVSQSTVSRVLNNPSNVKPDKRERVLAVIKELNYQPNLIARSLATNSTRTLALVTGTLQNAFYVETTNSIIHYATSRGYKTIVFFEEASKINEAIDLIRGNKVDGILISSITLNDPIYEEIKNSGIPYMLFNRRSEDDGNFVVLDNVLAGRLITQYILDLGHRNIAYLSGDINKSTFHERKLGFERVLQEAEESLEVHQFHIKDTKQTEIEKIIFKLLHLKQRPTVIVCSSTAIAFICMDTILSMGLKIPEDISIVGMDNVSMASHQAIQLTTVGNLKFNMGEIAAQQLIEMIEDPGHDFHKQIILQPELIIRRTAGRPARIYE